MLRQRHVLYPSVKQCFLNWWGMPPREMPGASGGWPGERQVQSVFLLSNLSRIFYHSVVIFH